MVMKKVIFLLLLAQTISFLYADTACHKHSYQWGIKAAESTKCYCNCEQHKQANNKCLGCGHLRVPKSMQLSPTTHKIKQT